MPLPHQFIAGELARSAQVNDNFQYLMDMLGQSSTVGSIQPLGSFIMGPRQTATLSAAQDKGGYTTDFFQISWNASWVSRGGVYKFVRKLTNVGGAAHRIGIRGFEVLATKERSGDMNLQMQPIFRVASEDAGRFMYVPRPMQVSHTNNFPTHRQGRKMFTTILNTPIPIYNNTAVGMGTSVRNAYQLGIPRDASAIIVNMHVTAGGGSGAAMHLYAAGQGNIYHGMVGHGTITGTGMGQRDGSQGIVPLGREDAAGDFVIKRTQYFELANVFIIGYLS